VSECGLEITTMRWPRPDRLVESWRKGTGLYSYNDKKNHHAPGKEKLVTEITVKKSNFMGRCHGLPTANETVSRCSSKQEVEKRSAKMRH
jgi:hypothetical protein